MTPSYPAAPRKGLALVVALAALAALTTILSVVTLQLLAARQALGRRHHQLQADWLARAGLEQAAARLLESPAAFTEDNRELVPDARVHIVVEKVGADLYAVTAEAEVSLHARKVVRTAHARFRRTASGSAVRLDNLSPEPPQDSREPRKD
jgi:type II secretory pathway component PulK